MEPISARDSVVGPSRRFRWSRGEGLAVTGEGACITTAQLVMIAMAATVGWAMRRGIGRKKIFLVAFVILPIRGFLLTLTDSPLGG